MKGYLVFPLLAGLTSCADDTIAPIRLDSLEANAAVTDAKRYLGEGAQVLAVCGASTGASYYLDGPSSGFGDDGIADGVTVFALHADGTPEILTRDAFREMLVTSEDAGEISLLKDREGSDYGVWVIQYPTTGVIVSHNLGIDENGDLIDVWTQNKPRVDLLPPRASIFLSMCESQS